MTKRRAPGAGRKPKPTALKVLAGNPGKRPLNDDEAKPDPSMPDCPEEVTGPARKEWERTSQLLHQCGLLTQIDRAALTVYCLAWGRMVEAERKLRAHGLVIVSAKGVPTQSPYLSIANKAREELMRAMTEFGMTPSSRTRAATASKPSKGADSGDAKGRFFGSA